MTTFGFDCQFNHYANGTPHNLDCVPKSKVTEACDYLSAHTAADGSYVGSGAEEANRRRLAR